MLTEKLIVERLGDCFWTIDEQTGAVINLNAKKHTRDWLIVTSPKDRPAAITRESIRAIVCLVMRVSVREFASARRHVHLVAARNLYFFICKKYLDDGYTSTGRLAGGRDRTTVMHGIQTVADNMECYRADIAAVESILVADLQVAA